MPRRSNPDLLLLLCGKDGTLHLQKIKPHINAPYNTFYSDKWKQMWVVGVKRGRERLRGGFL